MYYLTVYNEPMPQPAEPEGLDVEGVKRGIYRAEALGRRRSPKVQLLASGVGVPWVARGAAAAGRRTGASPRMSGASPRGRELRRDGLHAEQEHNFLNPEQPRRTPYVTEAAGSVRGPVRRGQRLHALGARPDPAVRARRTYATLGADGFGFSDTRAAARRYFKIDGPSLVVRTLELLADEGKVDREAPAQAIEKYRLRRRERGHHRLGRRRELTGRPAVAARTKAGDARLAAQDLG